MQQAKYIAIEDEEALINPTPEFRGALESLRSRTNYTPPKSSRKKRNAQKSARRAQRGRS